MDSADLMARSLPSTKLTCMPNLSAGLDSNDSNLAACKHSSKEVTFSVQPIYPQTSVSNTEHSDTLRVSASHHPSTCVTTRVKLHSTSHSQLYNVCLASREPNWGQGATVRHLPNSRLDVSITRDILPSCTVGVVTPSSSSIRGTACITTSSSSGRGGLSAYDSSSHSVHSATVDGLEGLRPTTAAHSLGQSNRPFIRSNQQQTVTTRSAAVYSNWITSRN